MKKLLTSGIILASLALAMIACDNESGPAPADSFSALSGTTAYEGAVNSTITISLDLKGEGISAVTANGQAVSFNTSSSEQTISFDYTLPATASAGEEFEIEVAAVTPDATSDITVTVTAIGETSKTPLFLDVKPAFSSIDIDVLLTSEDKLAASPAFVYGSMADGAGLLANQDGTFTLINNIEADFSVSRILLDSKLRPFSGEYILNASATGYTAMCSGSLITPAEHGFGPLYLAGGEWTANAATYAPGVYRIDPDKTTAQAGTPDRITAMGEWITENAVAIGQNAYTDKTVVFIGDDQSDNSVPQGHLAMYVGDRGDLDGGKVYGIRVTSPGIEWEMDMEEGVAYNIEFVELLERDLEALNTESLNKGLIGFSRVEDIDWRRGSAAHEREVYFAVTGREKDGLIGRGTIAGRVYKINMNASSPTGNATITCVLDGDKAGGKAAGFHSPDNVLATENYLYIQEDPNGITGKTGFAKLYQYDLATGELRIVLECDQTAAATAGYGSTDDTWEITGMIDVSDVSGMDDAFLVITQCHGWEAPVAGAFTDPKAVENVAASSQEGSMLYLIRGLGR